MGFFDSLKEINFLVSLAKPNLMLAETKVRATSSFDPKKKKKKKKKKEATTSGFGLTLTKKKKPLGLES